MSRLHRTLLIHALLWLAVGGAIVVYRQVRVKPVQVQPVQVEEMAEPTAAEMAEMERLTKEVSMSYYGMRANGPELVKSFRDLIALQERYLVPEHPEILPNREALVRFLEDLSWYADAEVECAVLLDILQRVMGKDDPYTAQWQKKYTELHRRTVELAEKEQMLRETCKKREQELGAEHPDMLNHYYRLAFCLYESRNQQDKPERLQEALEFARRAEALQIKSEGAGDSFSKYLREQIEAELKRLAVK